MCGSTDVVAIERLRRRSRYSHKAATKDIPFCQAEYQKILGRLESANIVEKRSVLRPQRS